MKFLDKFTGLPLGVDRLVKEWTRILNGQISLGDGVNSDNINGVWINTITPVTPNTDFTVSHLLGRAPSGYLLAKKNAVADIYDGSVAATASAITLRSSAASVTVRIFVF